MLFISIPKPCNENWNDMSPREQGAFCNVCAKTVVDFTKLSDEEVKNYFFQHREQKTCGRFRDEQLAEPRTLHELLSRPIPFWKKFLAIVCIVFGSFLSGCQSTTKDKVEELRSLTLGEPEYKYENISGVTLVELMPDTIFKKNICTNVLGDIETEGIIEPPVIELDGIIPIEITEEHIVNPDTSMPFTGEIKLDTIKLFGTPLIKVDSVKKSMYPNGCDTLPMKSIEP